MIGGLALIPCTVLAIGWSYHDTRTTLPASLWVLGWSVALVLPLALAAVLRGRSAWMNLLAALWVVVLGNFRAQDAPAYLWCALGSIGLVAWGLTEGRRERVNLGVAGFALTVLSFYFSTVMDKLDRSISLIGLGILFLGGGWAL